MLSYRKEVTRMQEGLSLKKLKEFIDSIGTYRHSYTYDVVFLPSRPDIAIARRLVVDEEFNDFNIIYVVWEIGGEIRARPILDGALTKAYIYIRSVTEINNVGIRVELYASDMAGRNM